MTQNAPNLTLAADKAPIDQALDFAKNAVTQHLMSSNPKILEHSQDINAVCNLLCDDFSKQQYLQEVAFLAVREVNPSLSEAISPFSHAQAEEFAKQLPALMQSPNFPEFQVHSAECWLSQNHGCNYFLDWAVSLPRYSRC